MLNPRLAYRYAKALLEIAIDKNQLDKVFADVEWLKAVCKTNPDFVSLLRSPIVKSDKKQKIIAAIAQNNIGEITSAFIRLLTSKGREPHLPEILNEFINLYKKHNNISTVKLTTAVAVSNELRDGIVAKVKKAAGVDKVELEEIVNPDIIGGFVLEMGDQMVDASIAYDLREVAKQFKNNDFIYKVR